MGLSAIAAALAFAAPLCAQCPSPGDCRKPHEGTGCEMPECCEIVCKANPLCCEIAWDALCAETAIELCEGIHCPADGDCTVAHASPGCNDFTCCDLVTALDGWCSYAAWDEVCAREAAALCGVAPCEIAMPADAIDEDEPCYERFNDGCSVVFSKGRIAPACGVPMKGRIVGGGPRDMDWFALDAATRRRVRVTVDTEFPMELQLVLGDCEGPNETRWLVDAPLCEGPREFVFLTGPGAASLTLASGNAERAIRSGLDCPEFDPKFPPGPDDPPPVQLYGLRWALEVDCLELGDIDGDGLVNAADLATLLVAWGPVDPGVPADPTRADSDLNGDGTVDAADITQLLLDW
jgi:hypothetical protein